jgi:hypothetical protein
MVHAGHQQWEDSGLERDRVDDKSPRPCTTKRGHRKRALPACPRRSRFGQNHNAGRPFRSPCAKPGRSQANLPEEGGGRNEGSHYCRAWPPVRPRSNIATFDGFAFRQTLFSSRHSANWSFRPLLARNSHHALASVIARQQANQCLGRIFQALDHVLLNFELACLDPTS